MHLLDLVSQDYLKKDELYRPGPFWEKATQELLDIIKEKGLEGFRNDALMSNFFVPKYGVPTNSFTNEMVFDLTNYVGKNGSPKQLFAIKEFLSGYFHALSDYRVFLASNNSAIKPEIEQFSESKIGNPKEHFEFDGKWYSRSSLNYLLGLCCLKKHLTVSDKINTVLEIGGGFGTLGEILASNKLGKYIGLDISPTSYVAHYYLKHIYGEENINTYNEETNSSIEIDQLKRCSVFHSWQIEKLNGKIDLFVNFISFQEMEPPIVNNYLNQVNRLQPKWILLRNIREGKRLKKSPNEHGVLVPIQTDDYISMLDGNYTLIDRNVFPFGYKTVDGFHSEITIYRRRS